MESHTRQARDRREIRELLERIGELTTLAPGPALAEIISGGTGQTSAGFPYISDRSFRLFIREVPHLFGDGATILRCVERVEKELEKPNALSETARTSVARATKVLKTVVLTAAVTAPPDLWLLRQVLSTHVRLRTLEYLLAGHALDPEEYAARNQLNLTQLKTDLRFLYARGYLKKGDGCFLAPSEPMAAQVIASVSSLPPTFHELTPSFCADWFTGANDSPDTVAKLNEWLKIRPSGEKPENWVASLAQIELGYRILPLVLGLHAAGLGPVLKQGAGLPERLDRQLPAATRVLEEAGFVHSGLVTRMGERVFSRGAGPFGIIAAYQPYLVEHEQLLAKGRKSTWVSRAANVAASQAANKKTFLAANDMLDKFCAEYDFDITVYVEHAVGQGEATRQRLERSGEQHIRYFGADLEDAAIDQALLQQKRGILPKNMQFIRKADIGEPKRVIEFLEKDGLAEANTVMVVGNGFHEIRGQTNEKLIDVFAQYNRAGYLVVFTEETALSDEQLLSTAWNTYHAGFRFVHEMSGQGLRPAWERDDIRARWSWRRCATAGGYVILDSYSYRTRTIYPQKRPREKNPSISETYFCVPSAMAKRLGLSANASAGDPGESETTGDRES